MIVRIVLLALLLAGMIHDLRKRELPAPLTLGALAGASCYALIHGDGIAVLVLVVLLLVDASAYRWMWLVVAFTLSIVAFLADPGTGLICFTFVGARFLWERGCLGGADVKLLAAVLLVFSSPAVLIPITLIGGIQGGIAALRKKREIPYVVAIFTGTLLYVLYNHL